MFCKKGVLRNFAKFTGKHMCQSLFLNKIAGLRPATLLRNRLWHRCFPVNFAKFLRTSFIIEHLWCLLLNPVTDRNVNFMIILWSDHMIISYYHIIIEQLFKTKIVVYIPTTLPKGIPQPLHRHLLTLFIVLIMVHLGKSL